MIQYNSIEKTAGRSNRIEAKCLYDVVLFVGHQEENLEQSLSTSLQELLSVPAVNSFNLENGYVVQDHL